MIVFAAVVLLVGAVFNVVTWPAFLRRVARDPRARTPDGRRTRFYRVHLVLVALALVWAAVSVAAAALLLVGLR